MNEILHSAADTLRLLASSRVSNIPGVIRVDSGIRGPVLGITACTHGNEPAGLETIRFLLKEFDLERRLLCGCVYLGVNNLAAAASYIAGGRRGLKNRYRYIDINMNRLPHDLSVTPVSGYEIRRARDLLPLWRQFDVGLDIHSTSQPTLPMIVNSGRTLHTDLVRGFPIRKVISNIDVIQRGLPAFGFYGHGSGSGTPVMEIEAGGHEDHESMMRGRTCAIALLRNLRMIDGPDTHDTAEFEEYIVHGSVLFPDNTYRLTRMFKNFEHVQSGTIIARGNGGSIVTERSSHTLFCPGADQIATWCDTSEEALFLTEPPRIVRS